MIDHWIRLERRKQGLSQFKLAQLSGFSSQQLSAWERGKALVPGDAASAIRSALENLDTHVSNGRVRTTKTRWSEHDHYRDRVRNARSQPPALAPPPTLSITPHSPAAAARLARQSCPQPTVVCLFSGAGGFALGFQQAGFAVLGYADLDDSAVKVFAANFRESLLLARDLAGVSTRDIEEWAHSYGEVDVLIGGPPCQGFSLAGKRDPHDNRNDLFRSFLHVAEVLRPKCVVMENVRLLTSMESRRGNQILDEILLDFERSGYAGSYKELNAQDYGVPQFRERVFFLGVRSDLAVTPPPFPEATHGEVNQGQLFCSPLAQVRTFRDATSDLELLESGGRSQSDPLHWAVSHPPHVLEWLKPVPEGASAHENADPRLRPPSGYNTTYKRLRWDEPCSTIGTTFGMISASRNVHPQCTRSLTVREAARCQSFPDTFEFFGNWGDIRRLIGNAVPPALAAALARHLRHAVLPRLNFTPSVASRSSLPQG